MMSRHHQPNAKFPLPVFLKSSQNGEEPRSICSELVSDFGGPRNVISLAAAIPVPRVLAWYLFSFCLTNYSFLQGCLFNVRRLLNKLKA